jgi:hypothetical protein
MTRLQLAAFGGDLALARRLLADDLTRPSSLTVSDRAVMTRYLEHQGPWDEAQRRPLAADIVRIAADDPMFSDTAVLMLASIGRADLAFDLLASPGLDKLLFTSGTGFLFTPAAASLRKDPRFWRAAANLGLGRYWASTGKWPDVCGREFSLAYCRAETAKALDASAV